MKRRRSLAAILGLFATATSPAAALAPPACKESIFLERQDEKAAPASRVKANLKIMTASSLLANDPIGLLRWALEDPIALISEGAFAAEVADDDVQTVGARYISVMMMAPRTWRTFGTFPLRRIDYGFPKDGQSGWVIGRLERSTVNGVRLFPDVQYRSCGF